MPSLLHVRFNIQHSTTELRNTSFWLILCISGMNLFACSVSMNPRDRDNGLPLFLLASTGCFFVGMF